MMKIEPVGTHYVLGTIYIDIYIYILILGVGGGGWWGDTWYT